MPKKLETGERRSTLRRLMWPLTGWANLGAGFTLLELLVVLAIMILAASVFPLVLDRALPARRVRAAAGHFAATIHKAEIQSIARDRPERLSIAGLTSRLAPSTHVDATGPGGRALRALTVYPDGSTNGARLLVRDGSARRVLVVSAITGRISSDPR